MSSYSSVQHHHMLFRQTITVTSFGTKKLKLKDIPLETLKQFGSLENVDRLSQGRQASGTFHSPWKATLPLATSCHAWCCAHPCFPGQRCSAPGQKTADVWPCAARTTAADIDPTLMIAPESVGRQTTPKTYVDWGFPSSTLTPAQVLPSHYSSNILFLL